MKKLQKDLNNKLSGEKEEEKEEKVGSRIKNICKFNFYGNRCNL